MAKATECQTPGATYSISVSADGIAARVVLPRRIVLSEAGASLLEDNIHNALEMVLRPYFQSCGPAAAYGASVVLDPEWMLPG